MAPKSLILAVNAGSSSVKLSLYAASEERSTDPALLADAQVTELTSPPAHFTYKRGNHQINKQELQDADSQEKAFRHILGYLVQDHGLEEMRSKDSVSYVCHRIVHGGDYKHVQRIDKNTYDHLEKLSDLAPLHNLVGLHIIRTAQEELPQAINMAYFDSAFHGSIPPHIYSYAIDPAIAEKNKLRKYGFHGISYAFIVKAVATHLGKAVKDTNLIALHLGSGASVCAIKGGQSLDTSMGLTPLSGLPGGSRSGDVDPSLMFHYTHDAGKLSHSSTKEMHITTAEEILNKKSGFKALTGTSDFGKISSSAASDEKCKLAVDLFTDRVLNFVGSYFVKLEGKIDALVFAGGIGEKSVAFRKTVVDRAACLGFEIDTKKNEDPEDDVVVGINSSASKYRVLIAQTNEQLEMARGCVEESKDFL